MRIDLTPDEHNYLMAVSRLAKGPEKQVDTVESNVAKEAGIEQSKEQGVKAALEDGGLIRFNDGVTKEFIFLEKSGEKYCEEHSEN